MALMTLDVMSIVPRIGEGVFGAMMNVNNQQLRETQ
jgi:hypothetical protein